MNKPESLLGPKCGKSIFIVESKIDDNIYKIKGCDGTLLEYVSDESLLPNEVICFSIEEYNKKLSISRKSVSVSAFTYCHKKAEQGKLAQLCYSFVEGCQRSGNRFL